MLSQTRQIIKYRLKELVFDKAGLQQMLDLRDKHRLEVFNGIPRPVR